MGFMKNMGRAAKARASRSARANSLRTVIRCQERALEKEYITLGRYYYNALRDKNNPVAEAHCANIDKLQTQRDSALEQLEQTVREGQVTVAEGEDGPTAVFTAARTKPNTIFHFEKGPVEITVSRDPKPKASEEIDLADVECFDHDPMPEDNVDEVDFTFNPPVDEPDDNIELPFEG